MRGLGEAPRLLLRYVGADYEDVQLQISDYDQWLSQKFTLGLDFPNLPYLIDGDVKLTQVCLLFLSYFDSSNGFFLFDFNFYILESSNFEISWPKVWPNHWQQRSSISQ